jgi:uncharacterized cofD-like protein
MTAGSGKTDHPRARDRAPRRVVALGGGTGLPRVLRGLRRLAANGDVNALTAVVAMTDDGGSSGRLRRTRGLPPPGDVRNCLVALASEEDLLAGLFQHRYEGSEDLGGHTLGNLILAALAEQTGSFMKAVEVSSRVLRTAGRILPATLDDVVLEALLEDGSLLLGETRIASSGKRVHRIGVRPESARPTPGVIEAVLDADLVALGPGSLYTSVLPNLIVDGVAKALARTRAVVVLVANLVSERGEAAGLDLVDHLEVIERHAGGPVVDAVLLNEAPIDEETRERYRAEGAAPLSWPERGYRGVLTVRRNLLAAGRPLRHDPAATAEGLTAAWEAVTSRAKANRFGA